jgi:hypothetical protein
MTSPIGELLMSMSRTEIAESAGLDSTTIGRLLRSGVRRVATSTASALFAVRNGDSPR